MNRLKETWHVGRPVWALSKKSKSDWQPVSITHIGRKWIEVLFRTKRGRCWYEDLLPEALRPRDPDLKGKDRPDLLLA